MKFFAQHLSVLFLKYQLRQPVETGSEGLLAGFAEKLDMDVEEIEETLLSEEIDHLEKRCSFPGCQQEFRHQPTPPKPHVIGSQRKRRRDAAGKSVEPTLFR